ncbi:MAG: ROK family protein [Lachnospiraceae bacterium]|nr:ROK family protein [Lachnospiraceae bacterium]
MYRVGIDLGGTAIKAGLVDENWNIVRDMSIPTDAHRPWQEVALDMAAMVKRLVADAQVNMEEVAGIGIGSPGTIDASTGTVVYSNNIVWEDVPLGEFIGEVCGKAVKVSNDANCAALGEVVAGAGRGVKNAIMLTLGTGVGGGIVIDGKVFEGGHAGGAELGHTVIRAGGQLCTCGRRGCLEAYASATALIAFTKRAAENDPLSLIWKMAEGNLDNVNGRTVFDASDAGDATAAKVVREYIENLGIGITDFVNVFRPDVVILGGGVCAQGEKLTAPIEAYVRDHAFGADLGFTPRVVTATLGNRAGIIGAAALSE